MACVLARKKQKRQQQQGEQLRVARHTKAVLEHTQAVADRQKKDARYERALKEVWRSNEEMLNALQKGRWLVYIFFLLCTVFFI